MKQSRGIYFKRAEVWQHTQEYATNFPRPEPSIKYIYNPDFTFQKLVEHTDVSVENIDCVDCGLQYDAIVLNLADDSMPGGIPAYSGAQEESIVRRSNYHLTLSMKLYPIRDNEAIFSNNVTIFKKSEDDGWELYDEPKHLDFIACPGLRHPNLDENGHLFPQDVERLRVKIRTILQVAYLAGHCRIILGASGLRRLVQSAARCCAHLSRGIARVRRSIRKDSICDQENAKEHVYYQTG